MHSLTQTQTQVPDKAEHTTTQQPPAPTAQHTPPCWCQMPHKDAQLPPTTAPPQNKTIQHPHRLVGELHALNPLHRQHAAAGERPLDAGRAHARHGAVQRLEALAVLALLHAATQQQPNTQ